MKLAVQLQNVSTVDLYYICQMVDNVTRDPGAYDRHIEDILGDARSAYLAGRYPKWTAFHVFIEDLIASVIWESANDRAAVEVEGKGLWVDNLLRENRTRLSQYSKLRLDGMNRSVGGYLEFISEEGIVSELCEVVARQVFFVLFANRQTLRAFGKLSADYVLHSAPAFAPEAFAKGGQLLRKNPPRWARDAVFHRDKGCCVFCGVNLTKTVNLEAKENFDHIVPLKYGGMNCVTNIQLCCESCNSRKGARHDHTSHEYQNWYQY